MSDTIPTLMCATCGDEAVGVCNVILAQPISMPYCARCVTAGLESWEVIIGTVYMMTLDAPDLDVDLPDPLTVEALRGNLALWAVDVIERSLVFHQKTWEDVLVEVVADLAEPRAVESE